MQMTHSSPCSTRGRARSRSCHLGRHMCTPPARTSHRWSRSSPAGRGGGEETGGHIDSNGYKVATKTKFSPGARTSATHPVEADLGLAVAGGEVGLGLGRGALGGDAVAHALVSALRLVSALLVTTLVSALCGATRTLAGTAGEDRRVKSGLVANAEAGVHYDTSVRSGRDNLPTCRLC